MMMEVLNDLVAEVVEVEELEGGNKRGRKTGGWVRTVTFGND